MSSNYIKRLKEISDKIVTSEDAAAYVTSSDFLNVFRNYRYKDSGNKKYLDMSDEDALHSFYDWRQVYNNNTALLGFELVDDVAMKEGVDLAEYGHIVNMYDKLPMPWNDDNTPWTQWVKNLGVSLGTDPINWVSFGVGGQAAKHTYKAGLKAALKGLTAKELKTQLLKETANDVAANNLRNIVLKGAALEAGVVGGATGAHDALLQLRSKGTGYQDEFDYKRFAIATGIGIGTGGIMGGTFTRFGAQKSWDDLLSKSLDELADFDFYGRSKQTGDLLFKKIDDKLFKENPSYIRKLRSYFEPKESLRYTNADGEDVVLHINHPLLPFTSRKLGNRTIDRVLPLDVSTDKIKVTAIDSDKVYAWYTPKAKKIIDEMHKKTGTKIPKQGKAKTETINISQTIIPDVNMRAWLGRFNEDFKTIIGDAPVISKAELEVIKDYRRSQNPQYERDIIERFRRDPGGWAADITGVSDLKYDVWDSFVQHGGLTKYDDFEKWPKDKKDEYMAQYDKIVANLFYAMDGEALVKREAARALEASKKVGKAAGIDEDVMTVWRKALEEQGITSIKGVEEFLNKFPAEERFKIYSVARDAIDDPAALIKLKTELGSFTTWDKITGWMTNSVLAGTATQIITVLGNLTNVIRLPIEKFLKVAVLSAQERAFHREAANEAVNTIRYMGYSTGHALKIAWKAARDYSPVLDAKVMKFADQGHQNNFNEWMKTFSPFVIKTVNRYIKKLTGGSTDVLGLKTQKALDLTTRGLVTFPTRLMGGIDEFTKNMGYRAGAMTLIETLLRRKYPEFNNFLPATKNGMAFKNRELKKEAEKLLKMFYNENGSARQFEDIVEELEKLNYPIRERDLPQSNQPLETARRYSNQDKGEVRSYKYEDGKRVWETEKTITGNVIDLTTKFKWMKPFGLLFVNTPGSLMRMEFQRMPGVGLFQKHMWRMLKSTNPEERAEALTRQASGLLMWTSAVMYVLSNPDAVIGGGMVDNFEQRRQKELLTGVVPYSVLINGKYVEMNKLDILFPLFAVKDIYDAVNKHYLYHDEISDELETNLGELAGATIHAMMMNFASKAYYKNFIDLMYTLSSGGSLGAEKTFGRKAEVYGASIAKTAYPLSSLFKQAQTTMTEYEQETYGLLQKINLLSTNFPNKRRSWTGNVVEMKNSWLLGSLPPRLSPFSVRKFNKPVYDFFNDRKFLYTPTSHIDKLTGIDLKKELYSENQSLYDKWMELKSQITSSELNIYTINANTGKFVNLKLEDAIVNLIENKKSDLYTKFPHAGTNANGKNLRVKITRGSPPTIVDDQQNYIITLIRDAEKLAYVKLLEDPKAAAIIEKRKKIETKIEEQNRITEQNMVNQILNSQGE